MGNTIKKVSPDHYILNYGAYIAYLWVIVEGFIAFIIIYLDENLCRVMAEIKLDGNSPLDMSKDSSK